METDLLVSTRKPERIDAPARTLHWLADGVFAVLLALFFFHFPNGTQSGLDPSWRMAILKFFQQHRQFGTDIVFTYGPLGFGTARTYAGFGFGLMVAWQLFASLAFTVSVIGLGQRLSIEGRSLLYLYFILLGGIVEEALYLSIIALVGVLFIQEARSRRSSLANFAAFLLGAIALVKFTNLLLALFMIGASGAFDLYEGRRTRALTLGAIFTTTFIAGWALAGQALTNLPLYLLHSWQISSGYEQAMVVGVPSTYAIYGATAMILLGLYGVFFVVRSRDRIRSLAIAAVFSGYGYLIWKHGFTRADFAHLPGFFGAIVFPAIALPFLMEPRQARSSWWIHGLALSAFGVALAGLFGYQHSSIPLRYYVSQSVRQHTVQLLQHLSSFGEFRRSYDDSFARESAQSALPLTTSIVQNGTVDVLGSEQAVALLNHWNYQPRPVFQSYSAYSPALERLNHDFFLSKNAPEFVLQKIEPIDERLPSMDDSQVLASLPQHYTYLQEENGFALWRKRSSVPSDHNGLNLVRKATVRLNEAYVFSDLSARNLWLQIHLTLSPLGRLRAFLYHQPIARLKVEDEAGVSTWWHLPLPLGETGFIVNPLISDLNDYVGYARGKAGRRVKAVSIEIYRDYEKYFSPTADLILSELPRPVADAALPPSDGSKPL